MYLPRFLDSPLKKFCRALPVAAQVNDVINIDPAERPPALLDVDSAAIDKIWENTLQVYRSGMHPMLSLCVRRHGEIAIHRSVGYARAVGTPDAVPAQLDTPVCLFSASKVVAAVLMHKLAEDGHIDLLNPVSYYLPEFAQAGKGNITVYQLLSHRAGVPGVPEGVPVEVLYDHDTALEYICQQKGLDPDGRVVAYHALTAGFVMTELIKLTTGKTVNAYLDEVIRQPMGMTYFHYGMPETTRERAAENYRTGAPNRGPMAKQLQKVLGADVDAAIDISNTAPFLDAAVPSGNLYATAEESCRFFQMLLQQGQWQGRQILSPLSVNRLTREAGRPQLDRSLFLMPMRYSAGTMLGGRCIGLYGRRTPYAFGHLGFSNIVCWADPERDLSVAVLNNGKPVIGNHIPAFLKLLDSISSSFLPCVNAEQLNRNMMGLSV